MVKSKKYLNGDINKIKKNIENIENIDSKDDEFGNTILHEAISKGNSEIVEIIINRGANIEIKNKFGDTPLIVAVEKGNNEILELLLNNGAKTEVRNNIKKTALLIACEKNKSGIPEILLKSGAAVNVASQLTWTPLAIASQNYNKELVEILLKNGAKIDLKEEYKGEYFIQFYNTGIVLLFVFSILFFIFIQHIGWWSVAKVAWLYCNEYFPLRTGVIAGAIAWFLFFIAPLAGIGYLFFTIAMTLSKHEKWWEWDNTSKNLILTGSKLFKKYLFPIWCSSLFVSLPIWIILLSIYFINVSGYSINGINILLMPTKYFISFIPFYSPLYIILLYTLNGGFYFLSSMIIVKIWRSIFK